MSRWLSVLLGYLGALVVHAIIFKTNPVSSWQDFITLPGYIAAIMTDPVFWVILILIYFILRGQWVFMKNN
jgi:hypothetical protein